MGRDMKIKTRWMDAIKDEAAGMTHKMPWERGVRRSAMISRRRADLPKAELAALGLSA